MERIENIELADTHEILLEAYQRYLFDIVTKEKINYSSTDKTDNKSIMKLLITKIRKENDIENLKDFLSTLKKKVTKDVDKSNFKEMQTWLLNYVEFGGVLKDIFKVKSNEEKLLRVAYAINALPIDKFDKSEISEKYKLLILEEKSKEDELPNKSRDFKLKRNWLLWPSLIITVFCVGIVGWYVLNSQNRFSKETLNILILNYGDPDISKKLADVIHQSEEKIKISVKIKSIYNPINVNEAKQLGIESNADVVLWNKNIKGTNVFFLQMEKDSLPTINDTNDSILWKEHRRNVKVYTLNNIQSISYAENGQFVKTLKEIFAIKLCKTGKYKQAIALLVNNSPKFDNTDAIFFYALYKTTDFKQFNEAINGRLFLIKKNSLSENSKSLDSVNLVNKSIIFLKIGIIAYKCYDFKIAENIIYKAYREIYTLEKPVSTLKTLCIIIPFYYSYPCKILDSLTTCNVELYDKNPEIALNCWSYLLNSQSSFCSDKKIALDISFNWLFVGTYGNYIKDVSSNKYIRVPPEISIKGFKILWGRTLDFFIKNHKYEAALKMIDNLQRYQISLYIIISDQQFKEFISIVNAVRNGEITENAACLKIMGVLY